MFAIAAPVAVLAIRAAMQFSNAVMVTRRMQAIVDATALAEVKSFEITGDATQTIKSTWAYLELRADPSRYNASDFAELTPQQRNGAISARVVYRNCRYAAPLTWITGARFTNIGARRRRKSANPRRRMAPATSSAMPAPAASTAICDSRATADRVRRSRVRRRGTLGA